MLPLVMTAASVALQAGSAIMGHVAAGRAAAAQNAHNAQVEAIQRQHRDEVLRFQNDVWKQDLDFAQENLDWSQDEWSRQTEWVGKAQEAITTNRNAEAFTLMLRGLEETIGFSLETLNVGRQGRTARATFAAKDRGVEGASIDAVMADVDREVGERRTVMDMNRSALNRQLYREAMALDAQADQQLSQLASGVKSYAPSAPIRAPSPVQPITPAAQVQGPSTAALAIGLGQAVLGGFNQYNQLTRQDANQTLSAGAAQRVQIR